MSNVKNYHEQGGMKWVVEGELEIAVGGKLTFQGKELKPAASQGDSEATTVDTLKEDFNDLLAKLKAAGLMKSANKQGGEGVLSLEEVKLYLRIDGDEEDTLIASFLDTAQELCEGILRFPLSEFEKLPETVKQALLYAVAAMYEKREGVGIKETLDVLKRLLFAYRKESW